MKFHLPKTLKGNLLTITLTLSIVMALITSVLCYAMFSENLQNTKIHSAETSLQFLRNEINGHLDDIHELIQWSQNNDYIINYVMAPAKDANYSAITNAAHERLTEKYLDNTASAYISRIIIANVDSSKYLQKLSNTLYSIDKNMVKIIKKLPYYEELITSYEYAFPAGIQQDPFLNQKELMLPIIRAIFNPHNEEIVGICFLQISPDIFFEPLIEYSNREELPVYLTINGKIYQILGNDIQIISDPPKITLLDTNYLVAQNTLIHKTSNTSNSTYYISSSLNFNDCYISIPVNHATSPALRHNFLLLLFIILFFISSAGLLLYLFLSKTVRKPVELLKKQLHNIAQGNFEQNPDIEWDNEFGEIGHNINTLTTSISNLMEQRISYETQKKDLEYQMLQSQINPHFLYNTLNSIKWMAVAQRASGIAEMTTALAHLLKNISKGTTTLISIRNELELLNDYFTIEKYRYGGTISLTYLIDDEILLDNQIIRFSLQPIVENSIFHGIEPKGQNGTITIHIYKKTSNTLEITITDNGVGMSPEKIQHILSGVDSSPSSFFRQIGIESVNKRIQYHFGSEYGISIESILGEYTTTKILLPLTTSEKKENL